MSQSGCQGSSFVFDGSISSQCSMDINPINGDIAYIAGAFIIIYGMKSSKQDKFIKNLKNRAFQCIAFSPDGKYLAAADNSIKQPEITVWLQSMNERGKCQFQITKTFIGHKFGVQSIKFSPKSDFLISMGDSNDKGLIVWDLDQNIQNCEDDLKSSDKCRIFSNQINSIINAFIFQPEQQYLITLGFSHLKIWTFEECVQKIKSKNTSYDLIDQKLKILEGSSLDLSKCNQKIFVSAAIQEGQIFALTSGGQLYIFSEKDRKLSKWMDIDVKRAFYCQIDQKNNLLFCGCSDGVIRIFNSQNLNHISTNQKPPPLGQTNIESGVKKITVQKSQVNKYSDVLSVICDQERQRLLAIYSENLIFMWDYKDIKKFQVIRTFLSHNGPIHDIQMIDQNHKIGITNTSEGQQIQKDNCLTRFVTCSSDRTIRFWHFVDQQSLLSLNKTTIQKGLIRNAYSKDMSKIIFVKNQDEAQKQNFENFKSKPIERSEDGVMIQIDNEIQYEEIQSRKNMIIEQAIRCIRLTQDGKFIACGDWYGNIRIYDIQKENFEEIKCIEAHENEVLSLDFARQISGATNYNDIQSDVDTGYLLVSGSRDQLIQIYDSKNDYEEVQIIESHQGPVTAVRFVEEKIYQKNNKISYNVSLISGGADSQLIKHTFQQDQRINDLDPFQLIYKEQFKNKIFSLDVARKASDYQQEIRQTNQISQAFIITGHERILCLRGTQSFQKIWEKRPDPSRKYTPDFIKVILDDSGSIAVASGTDKQVSIFETQSGKLLCKATCGEITTGMCFSQNGKHLITTSSIGVIYIWKLPENISSKLISNQLKKQEQSNVNFNQILNEKLEDDDSSIQQSQSLVQLLSLKSSQQKEQNPQNKFQNDIKNVFAQIGQVTDVVKQLENQSSKKSNQNTASSGFSFDIKKNFTDLLEKLNVKDTNHQENSNVDVSGISSEPTQNIINFGGNKNLPRWAQSICNSEQMNQSNQIVSNVNAFQLGQAVKNQQNQDNDDDQAMQFLFEKNLKQISEVSCIGEEDEQKESEDQKIIQQTGSNFQNQPNKQQIIDLLEEDDEYDNDIQVIINKDDAEIIDEQEKKINQNMRESQFINIFGFEGDESQISSNLRQSRDFMSKKLGNRLRMSIAAKYLKNKDTDSQNSLGLNAPFNLNSQVQQPVLQFGSRTPQIYSNAFLKINDQHISPNVDKKLVLQDQDKSNLNIQKTQSKESFSQNLTDLQNKINDLKNDFKIKEKINSERQQDLIEEKKEPSTQKVEKIQDKISLNKKDIYKEEVKQPENKVEQKQMKKSKSILSLDEIHIDLENIKKNNYINPLPSNENEQQIEQQKQPLNIESIQQIGIEEVIQDQIQKLDKLPIENLNQTNLKSENVKKKKRWSFKKEESINQNNNVNRTKENELIENSIQSSTQINNVPAVLSDRSVQNYQSLLSQQFSFDQKEKNQFIQSQINFQLQCEIQRINDSLKNINNILEMSQNLMKSSMNESQNINILTYRSQSPVKAQFSTIQDKQNQNITNQSNQFESSLQQQPLEIDQLNSQHLGKSVQLWNQMINKMKFNTSLKNSTIFSESKNPSQLD